MKKKLKILFLSSWYPNRTHTTLGNFNEKFAQAANLFNEVSALHVVADSEMSEKFQIIEENRNGVHTLVLYFKKKQSENIIDKFVKFTKFWFFYLKLYKYFVKKNGKPDLIHVNILYPVGIIALILKIIYKIKYVISENWTIYLDSDSNNPTFFANLISPIVAKNASCLLPVSYDLQKAMIKHNLKNEFVIVPNVVEINHFSPNFSKVFSEKKRIIHISSLVDDHKNISGILKVVNLVSQVRADFELIIIGDGNPNPHIELAKQLSVFNSFVKFYGQKTTKEIAFELQNSDFLLLFSNYENLPCVIVEALASGLPVLSSNVGGISEHIDNQKGILIDSADEQQLYNAILFMLDNYNKFDKNYLHNYAKTKFSYESVGLKLTEIYNKILKKK